jgi:hypothetical protein
LTHQKPHLSGFRLRLKPDHWRLRAKFQSTRRELTDRPNKYELTYVRLRRR